jgi:hypothetical protein
MADPAKFAPQYGGFCAFGTAGGYKAAIDPAAFTVVSGKLYLNCNRDVQKQWSKDIPGFVAKADKVVAHRPVRRNSLQARPVTAFIGRSRAIDGTYRTDSILRLDPRRLGIYR